ncbi:MAG: hypothetical protein IJ764_07075 [Bacteroidales bacterium]|nr:hypothetical protein [Bacteroidales bacterium]
MGGLVKQGLAKTESATMKLFDSLIKGETFMSVKYSTPKEYVEKYWTALGKANKPTLHSNTFKYIIYSLLYREGIKPFYTQAKVAFVPNVNFDAMLYNQSAPVSLSLKTSLRERYKQADLEAVALRYIYRRAKSYLLTMDSREAKIQKAKILNGDIMGLDEIIDCNTDDIDRLIANLKSMQFTTSIKIETVEGNLIQ